MEETGTVGKSQEGKKYLDIDSNPPQLPAQNRYGGKKKSSFLNELEKFTGSDPGNLEFAAADELANSQTGMYQKGNRDEARDNNDIPLIDPFITRVTIPHTNYSPWILETNFSESALSYITKIKVGSKDIQGKIRPHEDFEAIASTVPLQHEYEYSSAHDIGTTKSVEKQIEALDTNRTNEANHPGFDAIAKLAAEGARFVPVKMLGTALKVNSRFFTMNPLTLEIKYLIFQDLYGKWGDWFGRKYQIPDSRVKEVVLSNGTTLGVGVLIDTTHDFDLDEGKAVKSITNDVRDDLTRLLTKTKNKDAKRVRGKRLHKHQTDWNRGINKTISHWYHFFMKPLRRKYPTIYGECVREVSLSKSLRKRLK
jgi:hypothetical protein